MSGKAKITGYDELAAADLATGDMIEIVDVSESAAAAKNKKFALRGLRPYKVYVAMLTQSGTYAPVATVFENGMGEALTLTRRSAGAFSIFSASDLFTLNKTLVFFGNTYSIGAANAAFLISDQESMLAGEIQFITPSENGITLTDSVLSNTPIEIRVYD